MIPFFFVSVRSVLFGAFWWVGKMEFSDWWERGYGKPGMFYNRPWRQNRRFLLMLFWKLHFWNGRSEKEGISAQYILYTLSDITKIQTLKSLWSKKIQWTRVRDASWACGRPKLGRGSLGIFHRARLYAPFSPTLAPALHSTDCNSASPTPDGMISYHDL